MQNHGWKIRSSSMEKMSEQAYLTGHDGIDFFVMHGFVEAAKRKTPTPMDVYDAASWSAITPLSEDSIGLGNETVHSRFYKW